MRNSESSPQLELGSDPVETFSIDFAGTEVLAKVVGGSGTDLADRR